MGGLVYIAKDLLKNKIQYQYGFRNKTHRKAIAEEEYFFQTYDSYSIQMRDLRVPKPHEDGKLYHYIFFFL